MTSYPTLNRAKVALLWLRQLVCIHGPFTLEHTDTSDAQNPYAIEHCSRCGKETMKFYWV